MKRKILLIICLAIISLHIKAQLSYNNKSNLFKDVNELTIQQTTLQSNDKGIVMKHKLSLGITSSMEYCRNYLNDNNTTLLSTDRDNGFHIGLKLQYNFTEKLSLRSGIVYSEYYYNTTLKIHAIGDFIPYDTTYITQYKVKKMSWNIPLMLGYTLYSKNKFRFTPSAGFIFTETRHSSTDRLYAQVNLGVEYFITKNFFITFEPFVGYNLFPAQEGYIYNTQSNLMHGGIFSVNYQL